MAYKRQNCAIYQISKLSPLLFDLQTHFLQVLSISNLDNPSGDDMERLTTISKHALNIIEDALFASEALQTKLLYTTVSSAAIVQDVASSLNRLARVYEAELDTDITKKLEPVYSNEHAVKGILYGLATSLITASPVASNRPNRIIIAAQETSPKIQRIGVYSPDIQIYPSAVKNSYKLLAKARSVSPEQFHHSGLGLVVSDYLCRSLGINLKRFEHRGCRGLGFYIPVSKQLALIK